MTTTFLSDDDDKGHAQSPALKFHPYMVAGTPGCQSCSNHLQHHHWPMFWHAIAIFYPPGARKAALRKDMIAPAMMQAAGKIIIS